MAIREHKQDYMDAVTVHVDVVFHESNRLEKHEELLTQLEIPTYNLGAGSFNEVHFQVQKAVENYIANTRPELGHAYKSDFWYCNRYKTGIRLFFGSDSLRYSSVIIAGFTGASHRRFVGDHRKSLLSL